MEIGLKLLMVVAFIAAGVWFVYILLSILWLPVELLKYLEAKRKALERKP